MSDCLSELSFPIVIDQGATFDLPIIYQDSGGNVIDLTGYTAKMQVRETPEATGSPLVDLSSPSNGITITGASGKIEIIISSSLTAALVAPANAWYDLFITSPGGITEKLLFGAVTIYPAVTK